MPDDIGGPPNTTPYPIHLQVDSHLEDRNRLTVLVRVILAIPHLLLVGGPLALTFSGGPADGNGANSATAGGGLLGIAVAFVSIASWFTLVITGRHPEALWRFSAYYLRWRIRATAYVMLLRDEYPPFGEGLYAAELIFERPNEPRPRLTVLLRIILAIPHLLIVGVLGAVWIITTVICWCVILVTGRYPPDLYRFGVGVLRWSSRVEAYLLLLRDEYPPFRLSD